MTFPPVSNPETLRRILGQSEALFLDFDGPVCDFFAGLSAQVVVDQLCVVLADGGYGDPPPEIEKSSDPFDVLKYAATLGKTEAEYINAAFTALEVEAAATARPTPGANELIGVWTRTNRPLAIVTNNSPLAIEAYLDRHGLRSQVAQTSGRTTWNPSLLKPNSYLLNDSLEKLELAAQSVVFVGDSNTDMKAACAVGIVPIGYAKLPSRAKALRESGAAVVVGSIQDVVVLLEDSIGPENK